MKPRTPLLDRMLGEMRDMGFNSVKFLGPESGQAARDEDEVYGLCRSIANRHTPELFEYVRKNSGSPLEAAFYVAVRLYAAEAAGIWDGSIKHCFCPDHKPPVTANAFEGKHLGICMQHRFGRYRIDCLLVSYDEDKRETGRVAVEIDGHDFHERTKEQARHDRQKDRYIQQAGLPVFRFPGSEVYAGPVRCAKEALDALFECKLSSWMPD